MDFQSFLTSLGTSFVIFLVLMIVFALLSSRPGNNVVYYPNRILKGLEPFEVEYTWYRNPFSWIKEALSSSEQDVITMSGVDTAVYFVFLSTGLSIFHFSDHMTYKEKRNLFHKLFFSLKLCLSGLKLSYFPIVCYIYNTFMDD